MQEVWTDERLEEAEDERNCTGELIKGQSVQWRGRMEVV